MAPVRPTPSRVAKRPTRTTTSSRSSTSYPSAPGSGLSFSTTKKDKKLIKHSLFLTRVQKSSGKARIKKRRSRPSRKLVANLESLTDALPDLGDDQSSTSAEKASKMVTITNKPGAGKKRSNVEREERTKFGKNLALLSQARAELTSSGAATLTAPPMDRWAALRQGITNNMGVSNYHSHH